MWLVGFYEHNKKPFKLKQKKTDHVNIVKYSVPGWQLLEMFLINTMLGTETKGKHYKMFLKTQAWLGPPALSRTAPGGKKYLQSSPC